MLDLMSMSFEGSSKVIGEVRETYEYDLFSFIDGNRPVNSSNYKKLKASMTEKLLMCPIIVNEKYEIIDGQHRYSASKELGLPIRYIVVEGYDLKDVKRYNVVSKNWKLADFLNMHASEGKYSYVAFEYFLESNNIPISIAIKIFTTIKGEAPTKTTNDFESGTFSIDTEELEQANKFIEALEYFSAFEDYKTVPFLNAFMKLYFREDYDHEIMIKRIAKKITSLKHQSNMHDYLDILCNDIYSTPTMVDPIKYDVTRKVFYK